MVLLAVGKNYRFIAAAVNRNISTTSGDTAFYFLDSDKYSAKDAYEEALSLRSGRRRRTKIDCKRNLLILFTRNSG